MMHLENDANYLDNCQSVSQSVCGWQWQICCFRGRPVRLACHRSDGHSSSNVVSIKRVVVS